MTINACGGQMAIGELLVDNRLLLMGTRLGKMPKRPQLNFGSIHKMSEIKVL